ncbi:MAG: carbon storage regulator CsrA [Candidatus Latescibacteria bacterium]|nr:carbon storage regulator CsrA [Candidatus Latescibacterota bacterium]
MLVLSRKPGERLYIGSDIIVTVLETSGKQVRIGIEAPESIRIYRAEIREQIERENRTAALKGGYIDRLRELGTLIRLKSGE